MIRGGVSPQGGDEPRAHRADERPSAGAEGHLRVDLPDPRALADDEVGEGEDRQADGRSGCGRVRAAADGACRRRDGCDADQQARRQQPRTKALGVARP